jgi:hypothetical protein
MWSRSELQSLFLAAVFSCQSGPQSGPDPDDDPPRFRPGIACPIVRQIVIVPAA